MTISVPTKNLAWVLKDHASLTPYATFKKTVSRL